MCKHAYNVDEENRMVVGSDTVVDPHTMMVESFDTPITDVAMSAFISADDSTCRTKSIRVESFNKSQERNFL